MIEGKICIFDRVVLGSASYPDPQFYRIVSMFRSARGERVFVLECWRPRRRCHEWKCETEFFLRQFYERAGRSPRRSR